MNKRWVAASAHEQYGQPALTEGHLAQVDLWFRIDANTDNSELQMYSK